MNGHSRITAPENGVLLILTNNAARIVIPGYFAIRPAIFNDTCKRGGTAGDKRTVSRDAA
jgi:hypothetical protein